LTELNFTILVKISAAIRQTDRHTARERERETERERRMDNVMSKFVAAILQLFFFQTSKKISVGFIKRFT